MYLDLVIRDVNTKCIILLTRGQEEMAVIEVSLNNCISFICSQSAMVHNNGLLQRQNSIQSKGVVQARYVCDLVWPNGSAGRWRLSVLRYGPMGSGHNSV